MNRKEKKRLHGGWGGVKVQSYYCVPISKTCDERFLKKATTNDTTLHDHMIDQDKT